MSEKWIIELLLIVGMLLIFAIMGYFEGKYG